MKKRLAVGLATVFIVCVSAARASAITVFNSEASYNTAVGSQLFMIDFNGYGAFDGFYFGDFSGMVDFGSPEAANPDVVYYSAISGKMSDAWHTSPSNVGPLDGVFANPVNAFGLIFSSSGSPQTLDLYDVNDILIGSAVSNPGGFFGVLSNEAIKCFVINNGLFIDGMRDRFFIDDFRANNVSSVPEPSTLPCSAAAFWASG